MENKFYIYAHTIASHGLERPFGEIFYIGKGFDKRAYTKSNRTKYWKNIVNKYGYGVHFFETELTNEQAIISEIRYIKAIGREDLGLGTLINFTNGGEGVSGRIPSEETREKIRKAGMGKTNAKGSKHSKEAIEKTRLANIGKKVSNETKIKIGEANKGKKLSEATKEKMRNVKGERRYNYGKKISDGQRIKLVNFRKGKKSSNETKEKMRKSMIESGANKGIKNANYNPTPVLQYDLQGDFVKEWKDLISLREAGFDSKYISKACRGKSNSSFGYKWRFKT